MKFHLIPLGAALAVACQGGGGASSTRTITNTITNTDHTTSTVTNINPPPPSACEQSGNICVWMGAAANQAIPTPTNPPIGGVSADGLDRQNTWLYLPVDIDFASDGTAYYPDYNNHRIRRVDLDGTVTTLSGTTLLGDGPNTVGSVVNCWAGCDALDSAWNHPTQVIVNPANEDELFVAAWHNSRVNVIDTATGTMTWYAGTGGRNYAAPNTADANADGFADGDLNLNGSILDEAQFDLPSSLAFSADGTLYVADQANHMIRRINPDGSLENVAGQPRHAGYGGDGGPALASYIHGHTDQKADPGSKILVHDEILYLIDTVNGVVRQIDLGTMTIDHVAGKYESLGEVTYKDAVTGIDYLADGGSVPGFVNGPVNDAVFNTPRDLAVGIDGEIYVAEPKNNCVRVIDTGGNVSTFAGQCGTDTAGFSGDGGPAADSELAEPFGVAVDPEGNVYIADTANQVIRRVKR